MQRARSVVPIIAVCVLLLFGIFAAVLWQSRLLEFTGTESSAKAVAAVAALVGGLIAAVVSLMGILLKHSIDERAEARLQLDADRNEVLRRDTEARLKLEAAIQAVKLFAGPDGKLSPAAQRAGALFTLVRLGQHDLTISLVGELLGQREIPPATAASLLETVFKHDDADMQREAFGELYQHAEQFVTPYGFELPLSLLSRVHQLSPYVRDWTPLLIARILMVRRREEWLTIPYALNSLVGAAVTAWMNESERQIKDDAAGIVRAALAAFPQLPRVISTRGGRVLVDEAREATKECIIDQ